MQSIEKEDLPALFEALRDVFTAQREALIALDGKVGDSDLGITMNKGEPKLKEWINAWVNTNLHNGKLNTIYKKYHGRDLPANVVKPV